MKFESGKGNENLHPLHGTHFINNFFFFFHFALIELNSQNLGQKPIIVIDFLCITNGMACDPMESICGGRQKILLNRWIQLLEALKATDCAMVFFSDLNVQEDKIDEWSNRRNNEFDFYAKLYDSIVSGKSLATIIAENEDGNQQRSLTSGFYGMAVIAQQYGEFSFSTRYEADLEIAHYAKHHNAMAIVSDDTDFLIFEGSWRLWSGQNIQINKSNQLKTTEYNRHNLVNILSLSTRQLPLFATLMGNDFTKPHFDELNNFHKHLAIKSKILLDSFKK